MSDRPDRSHGRAPEPPADPEAWTDEEWLEWLRATDGEGFGGGDGEEDGAPTRMTALTRRPTGRALGAAMIGLRNAIYGFKEDEVAIVVDAGGDPPNDRDLHDVHLDPEHPERSEVVVRRRAPGPVDSPERFGAPAVDAPDVTPSDDPSEDRGGGGGVSP